MAKVPKPPKPKLPKAKRTLGGHIKNETRKAVSKSLTKNFGILGSAIAKKYIRSSSPSQSIKANPNKVSDKKIVEKKIRETSSAVDAIMESAHQVASALETTSVNASRGFAAAKRQTDIMGEEVTKGLNELSSLLDRMLYQQKAASSGGGSPPPTKRNNNSDEDNNEDGGGTSPRLRSKVRKNPNKRKPRSKERLNKIKSRLNRSGPVSRAAKGFGRIKIPFLNYLLEGYQSYSDVQSGVSSVGKATAGFLGGLGGGTLGALGGSAVGSLAGPVGTFAGGLGGAMAGAEIGRSSIEGIYDRIFGKAKEEATISPPNKLKNTDHIIHKMKYKADKIKFVASNTIEFKSKTGTISAQQTTATKKTQQHNSGFFNNLIDKLRGGSEGSGIINNTVDQLVGSPSGGAGTLNNLTDKLTGSSSARGGAGTLNNLVDKLTGRGGDGVASKQHDGSNTADKDKVNGGPTTSPNGDSTLQAVTDQERDYKNTGHITLNGHDYNFVTGGGGRGSAPTGEYEINPNMMQGGSLGNRWMLTQKGQPQDTAYDPKIGAMRSNLRIHQSSGGGTLGCIGIIGGDKVYRDFQNDLLVVQKKNGGHPLTLRLGSPHAQQIMSSMDAPPPGEAGKSPQQNVTPTTTTTPTVPDNPSQNIEPAKPEISNKETLAPPDQINKRPNYATDNERSAIKQPTSQTQDTKNDDLDHRPRQEAAPKQSFSDYMDTVSGMEDAY